MSGTTGVDVDLEVLALWSRRQTRPPRLELRCAEAVAGLAASDDDVDPVRLGGCLAHATSGCLAEVVSAARGVVLRLDACEEDPSRAVADLVDALRAVDARDRLLVWRTDGGVAPGARGRAGRELDVGQLPPRRRGLVGWFLPEPDEAEEVSPPRHRRIVPALLTVLGERPVPESASDVESPALDLVSSGCTACGTCVQVCPAGVLALDGSADDTHRRLEFTAAGCIGCRRCIDLCPADALRGDTHLDWGTLLTAGREAPAQDRGAVVLEELSTARCARCRAPFAGDGNLCPVCASRRADPFGSTMPAHLVELLERRGAGD